MKKLLLTFFALFIALHFSGQHAAAQTYDWAENDTADYQLNPDFPLSCVAAYDNHVVHSFLETNALVYGQAVYGTYKVRMHDQQGMTGYTFTLGPKAAIQHITTDPAGNVFIIGSFMDTLDINGSDTLEVNSMGLFANNIFLIRISSGGALMWKRNVSLQHAELEFVDMLTLDGSGNPWYSYADFQVGKIFGTDGSGNDVDSIIMNGRFRTVSGLSFEGNNLYVAGSCEQGPVSLGGFSTTVTDNYNMFFTRYNSARQVSWFQTAHDITFQHPQIISDGNGNAYFSCHLFDSTSIGGVSVPSPQWNGGIVIAKIESTGNVLWAMGTPQQPTITGSFNLGKRTHLIVMPDGGFALEGHTRGSIDWGNNIITGSSVVTDHNFTVLVFDDMGNAKWKIDAPASYVSAQSIALDPIGHNSTYYGYITCVTRDTSTFGPFTFPQPSDYTLSTTVARFGFTSTGINETFNKKTQQIYPNPSGGVLNFMEPLSDAIITITDLNGRMMRKLEVNEPIYSLNTGLDAGCYILTVDTGSKQSHTTFVVNH